MKSSYGSLLCPTAYLAVLNSRVLVSRWGITGAPCRNRTYNLMIKSQLRASHLSRTEGVYLGFQATNDAELVPPVYPKSVRSFPSMSHGVSQLSRVRHQKSSIETAVGCVSQCARTYQARTVTGSPLLKAKGPLLDKLAARVRRGE